jgi:hypothetical protein
VLLSLGDYEPWVSATSPLRRVQLSGPDVSCRIRLLGGLHHHQIAEATGENICIAARYMARPEVWRAVLALADKLEIWTDERPRGGAHRARADVFRGAA